MPFLNSTKSYNYNQQALNEYTHQLLINLHAKREREVNRIFAVVRRSTGIIVAVIYKFPSIVPPACRKYKIDHAWPTTGNSSSVVAIVLVPYAFIDFNSAVFGDRD